VTGSKRTSESTDQRQGARPTEDDVGLAALRQAELHYREALRRLEQLHRDLARAQSDQKRLSADMAAQQAEVDRLRRQADQQRERADALADALRDIHQAFFSGNIYNSILKVCLTLTGATRGEYLTSDGPNGAVRVRAAVDTDPDSDPELSQLTTELCGQVLQQEQVVVRNDLATVARQPDRGQPFRNCVAAPVVLRSTLSGVIIVADKAIGDFDDQDTQVLLSIGSQAAVAVENARLEREMEDAYLGMIGLLADAMAARDPRVHAQQRTGSRRARALAERLGLPEYDQSLVYYAMLLHDVGNIGVSDGVLNKPVSLLEPERELIRAHVQIGHDLLTQVALLDRVAEVVRHHHERYDGSGYPDGLAGDDIPIAARIIAVVDAYGAMLAPRSYRPALTPERACLELRRCAGTQFDPRVVDTFFLAGLDASEAKLSADNPEWRDLRLSALEPHRGERIQRASS
jgi:HD-GYP domain-containing protein (c-di-GMP phosphodiesterase class II)